MGPPWSAGGFATVPVPAVLPGDTITVAVGRLTYCWGSNATGELGTGGTSSSRPALVAAPVLLQSVSAGDWAAAA